MVRSHFLCLVRFHSDDKWLDLFTIGGMNEFFRQIIDDILTPKHIFNIQPGNMALRVFKRYGSKIRQLHIKIHDDDSIEEINDLLIRFCSIDRLRDVSIAEMPEISRMPLPPHFQRVERFHSSGCNEVVISTHLFVTLSESLRYLHLDRVYPNGNFNWTELKSLTEIYFNNVHDINIRNFIEFLRLRPTLEVFSFRYILQMLRSRSFRGVGRILRQPNSSL